MATTNASFRIEQRELLSDAGTVELFKTATLDRWRDAELRGLYRFGIAKEDTNYTGTHTSMLATTTTQTDFALPSGWLRVTKIEFWTNTSATEYVNDSYSWDDRVRASFITIYDAPLHYDHRIKLMGLKEWTGIDDSTMPQEVVDVVLYGSVLRALTSLINKRGSSRRAAAASRNSDTTMGSLAFWRRAFKEDYREAIRSARRALRPIGTQ